MKTLFALVSLVFGLALFGIVTAHADPYAPIYITSVRNVNSTTNIGVTTPVQLIASLPGDCAQLDVYNSSGQTLELMTGKSGSETRVRILSGDANGRLLPQRLRAGDRVSARALSAAATTGELDITCLQF